MAQWSHMTDGSNEALGRSVGTATKALDEAIGALGAHRERTPNASEKPGSEVIAHADCMPTEASGEYESPRFGAHRHEWLHP